MSVQPSRSTGAIPRGWSVEHSHPDAFVVRCTACGRVSIKDDRGRAHRFADNHAIHCSPTGVTPVSQPEGPASGPEPKPDAAVAVTGFDAFEHGLVGEEIVVRYDSIDPSSDGVQVAGDVVAMISAPDANVEYRGLMLRLPAGSRRRLDLVDGTIECEHNSTQGWRTIGELTSVAPVATANAEPVAMTDGGVQVDESEPANQADADEQSDDTDDEPENRPDTLTTAIEAGTLQQTVDILLSVADECIFNLGRDGLTVRLVDPANVYMADVTLSDDAFERVGEGQFAIGVNLDRLDDILGKADGDDVVELVLDLEVEKLHLEFSNVEMDFAGIDPDSVRAEPDLPDLDLPNEFESQAKHLQRAVDICKMVSDHARVHGDLQDQCIRLTAEGDVDDARVELREDLGFADVREDASSLFSIGEDSSGSPGYLDEALGAIPKTTPISVTFGEDFPIWIEWEFAEGTGQVTQMIAPRIEADR
jgi:proliferating cell nuclear antigen